METPSRPRSHAYVDLARQLSARGYAVLRYARDGAVVVNEEKANAHKRFAEKVKVLRRACQILRDLEPGIKGLAVAGHSEGRVVALMLLMEPSSREHQGGRLHKPLRACLSLLRCHDESG